MYRDRLILLVDRNNITKRHLAQFLGISESCYNHYEKEKDIIPIKHLVSLSDYFNVSVDYILGFSDNESYINECTPLNSKNVGLRLKEFRKDNSLTQSKLAAILNTEQPVIANYENGKNIIATPFLYQICKKYMISADYLLGKIDDPKYLK